MTVPQSTLYLVVVRGPNSGARMQIDATPRLIGRATDADLPLTDPRVSRRHLTARVDEGGAVLVEMCDGAAPFLLDGLSQPKARIQRSDTIVIGDTALVVMDVAEPATAVAETQSTDLGALLTGLAADVRGVAATMELIEGLDAAQDEAAICDALTTWGARYVSAIDGNLLVGEAIDADLARGGTASARVVERKGPPGTVVLLAPAHATVPAWISLTCSESHGRISDTTRRLVALAGRLCASSFTRVRTLRASHEEQELFRRAALGTARSFLGESPAAREVARLAGRLASSDVVVLLEGETGVGKTFLARLLHESGARARETLRVLNCAAIPETLLESELFGHEKGAFTGAAATKQGALEAAGRGTVLLDEVGELPLVSQAKLLRVLEDKRFERLGSNRAIPLEARVLAATNRDLGEMVQAGTFRADLFYRLAVVKLRVPSLRERGEDLPLLAERMLADLSPSAGRRVHGFSPDAMSAIRRYPWPGNVRELRNAIERALAIGESAAIEAKDLPESVTAATPPQPTDDESLVRLPANLAWLEARAIEAAIRATQGNQQRAALLLGINRATLYRKLKSSGGTPEGDKEP